MTVAQLARRTGVAPSALRYYETVGLLRPTRAENGYRTYDEEAVDRLQFVAAAKRMNLDLATIAGLLRSWETSPCAKVKSEVRPVVEARLATATAAEHDARALIGHLRASLDHLDQLPDRSQRCSPECAFLRAPVVGPAVLDEPTTPVACSLHGAAHEQQVQRWHELTAGATTERSPSGAVVSLPLDRLPTLADLIVDEVRCCGFLDFELHVTSDRVRVTISAPAAGEATIDELLDPKHQESSA